MPQNPEQQTKSCVEAVSLNLSQTELQADQFGDSGSSQLPVLRSCRGSEKDHHHPEGTL